MTASSSGVLASRPSRSLERKIEIGVVLVAAALGFTLLLRLWIPLPYWFPFLIACTASAWIAGRSGGWTAVICSTLACDYFFSVPLYSMAISREELPEFLAFTISMIAGNWFGSWRMNAEAAMRRKQEELASRVEAGGIELEKINEALRAEINQREQAEYERRITELRWRAVFDNAVVGMAMVDSQGFIMSANPRFIRLVGAPGTAPKGHRLTDYLAESGRPRFETALDELMAGNRRLIELELQYPVDQGLPTWLRINIVMVSGSSDFQPFVIAFCEDISEPKRAEEALLSFRTELAQASRLTTVGELTASIAHELNQPLSAVVTNGNACLRWLASEPPNLREAHNTINWIMRDAKRAAEVVARIRGLMRKSDARWETIDFNHIVREGLELMQGELQRQKVAVSTLLSPQLPPIRGVRVQLQQVFLNLVINALEAMSSMTAATDQPRQLRIKSSERPGETAGIIIEVSDSGPGIAVSDLDKLFGAFYTTKPEGTGLGLWISQSIIEHHSGKLTAIPDPDQGMTFLIDIPCEVVQDVDPGSIAGEDFVE
jgi:PAS domain S-box-containing protein